MSLLVDRGLALSAHSASSLRFLCQPELALLWGTASATAAPLSTVKIKRAPPNGRTPLPIAIPRLP